MFEQSNVTIVDPQTAFMKCFNSDEEREQHMYMYSMGNYHYFKGTIENRILDIICEIDDAFGIDLT